MKYQPVIASRVSYVLVGLVMVSVLGLSIRSHLMEPYYHVIDSATYRDFLWVRDNVPSDYQIGVLDTSMAWAFASVTGKYVYAAEVAPNFHEQGRSAMEFINSGASDTSWLRDRNIDIVYTKDEVKNNELMEIHSNVYILVE